MQTGSPNSVIQRPGRTGLILWITAHIVLLAVLLNSSTGLPGPLAVIAAGLVGTSILWYMRRCATCVLQWLQRLRANHLFYTSVPVTGTLLMLVVWLTPVGTGISPLLMELLRGYATLLILCVTYLILFWQKEEIRLPLRAWAALGVSVAAAGVILTLHYLDRFPQLNTIDELHNWVVQWTYANTGLLGDTLYKQMIPLPQAIYPGVHVLLGLLLRLIGDTFWQARFSRYLLACLALPFIYLSGKRMYGQRAGLFAVAFAVFFIVPTNFVRPDVFVGVMLSVAIYVYLRAQATRRLRLHYLTGLCVAVGAEGHALAYRFGLAFGLIYIIRWFYEMYRQRRLFIDGRVFALAMGGLTWVLIYLAIHILPNVEQGLHFIKNNGPGAQADQLRAAQYSIQLQLEAWITTSPFEFVLVLVGIVLAARQRTQGDWLLLTLVMVSEGLLLGTYGYYREYYQAHYLPIVALLVGRLLANVTELRAERLPAGRPAGLVLAAMVFVVMIASLAYRANAALDDPLRNEFTAIGRRLKTDLPPSAVIVGNENYFLEMRSPNYYGIETITTDTWFLVNYAGYQLWEVTRPDIFILSGSMDLRQYTDIDSIYRYLNDHGFYLARCYTETGLVRARVYVRQLPSGWIVDPICHLNTAS